MRKVLRAMLYRNIHTNRVWLKKIYVLNMERMIFMNQEETVNILNKLINKFIFQSHEFIKYSAFPYGLFDLVAYQKKSAKLCYDYEYFVFTKTTKTLIAIRELLKKELNEDVVILVRSMFENYLSCRYLLENEDRVDDFIANPLNVALAYYNINPSGEIFDRDENLIGKIENDGHPYL